MKTETQEKLKAIKSKFRLSMNGVVSQSMREKGLGYKINWGVALPVLKNMAAEYGKDFELACELWKEDIRECKILATLIMPSDSFKEDLAGLWGDQMPTQEIAEMLAFNLLQHVEGSKALALRWLASNNTLKQICGYQLIARLLTKGENFTEREINELIDQAQAALGDTDVSVRHSATNMLVRFAAVDDIHRKILKSAFKTHDLDIF